jgi:hypothetical protein
MKLGARRAYTLRLVRTRSFRNIEHTDNSGTSFTQMRSASEICNASRHLPQCNGCITCEVASLTQLWRYHLLSLCFLPHSFKEEQHARLPQSSL